MQKEKVCKQTILGVQKKEKIYEFKKESLTHANMAKYSPTDISYYKLFSLQQRHVCLGCKVAIRTD